MYYEYDVLVKDFFTEEEVNLLREIPWIKECGEKWRGGGRGMEETYGHHGYHVTFHNVSSLHDVEQAVYEVKNQTQ